MANTPGNILDCRVSHRGICHEAQNGESLGATVIDKAPGALVYAQCSTASSTVEIGGAPPSGA
jgi:hypothetical protein